MSVTTSPDGIIYSPDIFTVANVVDADVTVTNSATLVDVSDLTIPIGKRERIMFRYTLFYTTTAAGDLKYRVEIPASPTLYRLAIKSIDPSGTHAQSVITSEADGTVTATSGTDGLLELRGILVNAGTEGEVKFQFAQNTATSAESAIIRRGSFLEFRRF